MYVKDKKFKKVRLQELHNIQESTLEDESEEKDIFNELSQHDTNYKHLDYVSYDINKFYINIYNYYIEGSFSNIILKHLLNIFMLFLTNIFTIYIFTYIEWDNLIQNCKFLKNKCEHLNDFINYNNKINPIFILFNILSLVYIIIYIFQLIFNWSDFLKLKKIF